MEKQMGAGTFLSMGPNSALAEGWNGLGQVGIPRGLPGDHGLRASPLAMPMLDKQYD